MTKILNRHLMYFFFLGLQHFFILMIVIGMLVKPLKRDPNVCAEEVGLLAVQITASIDVGVRAFVFIIMVWRDRFAHPPEMAGKLIGCFITSAIITIICILGVFTGNSTVKKAAFFMFFQGLGYANEGFFHLYHLRTYRPKNGDVEKQ